MKKWLVLFLFTTCLAFLLGCESKNDYTYDLQYYQKQGMVVSKIIIIKNVSSSDFFTGESQHIINTEFDDFNVAFDITWTYNKYYMQTDAAFYNNHTFDYTVAVFYGSDSPSVVVHIYSDYILRFGQPFFKLNQQLMGDLITYLEGLTYEPFVSPT